MTLNNSFVYQPVPLKEFYENRGLIYPVLPEERRFVVYINLPVYSLRYRTLLEIRDLLKKPEEAEKLDLPHSLIVDLKKVITLKDKINIILPQ